MPTITYRRSYETGSISDDWRITNVILAYKKCNNSLPSNYRLISFTCIACKMMEHIVTSSSMEHAGQHNTLYQVQHGFRNRRSSEIQLLESHADVLNDVKDGVPTDVLIIHFPKAFDKVGHNHLLENTSTMASEARRTHETSYPTTDKRS